ncbi:MAG: DUF1461 domain-containing protein [Candidatus Woesearchaeota archaeon]
MNPKKFLIIFLIILIPIISVLGSFRITLAQIDGTGVKQDTLDFLQNRGGNISEYTQVEQEHLVEVKQIINGFFTFFSIAFFITVVFSIRLYSVDKKELAKVFLYGGLSTIGLVVLLFLLGLNFDWLFTIFHKILFKTQWQFPSGSLLIKLFPEHFFIIIFGVILVIALIIGMIFTGIGYWLKKK